MANMSLKKNPMPSQDPNVRNKNFDRSEERRVGKECRL